MHILTSKYAGTIYHSKLCKNLVTPTSTHATQIKQPRKKKSSTNQRAGFISQIASGRIDKCVQPIVKKRLIIIYIVIMKITQDGLKNPDKLYIVAAECLMSCTISLSVSILFLFRHKPYLDVFAHIRDFLEHHHFYYFCGEYVECLWEGTLWGPV